MRVILKGATTKSRQDKMLASRSKGRTEHGPNGASGPTEVLWAISDTSSVSNVLTGSADGSSGDHFDEEWPVQERVSAVRTVTQHNDTRGVDGPPLEGVRPRDSIEEPMQVGTSKELFFLCPSTMPDTSSRSRAARHIVDNNPALVFSARACA